MTTTDDPIVEEVRKARRMIAAFYGDDLLAIAKAASRGFSDFPGRKDESPLYHKESNPEASALCVSEDSPPAYG